MTNIPYKKTFNFLIYLEDKNIFSYEMLQEVDKEGETEFLLHEVEFLDFGFSDPEVFGEDLSTINKNSIDLIFDNATTSKEYDSCTGLKFTIQKLN
jgi:hypothetical protein